ncbi:ArnT family glycosyltransferase [Planctomycetota bacterium]
MDNQQVKQKNKTQNRRPLAEWAPLAAILLAGLLLRGAYLWELVKSPDFNSPTVDAALHDYWARGLANGDWDAQNYSNDPEIRSSAFFRPPGYSYFLALVYFFSGSSFFAARLAQMGLGLVNAVLAYFLGRSIFGRPTGLILAGMMSVYWIFIFYEGELLSPTLVICGVLLLMNVLCLWTEKFTYQRTIAAGAILGLLALVRPNVLLFVPIYKFRPALELIRTKSSATR